MLRAVGTHGIEILSAVQKLGLMNAGNKFTISVAISSREMPRHVFRPVLCGPLAKLFRRVGESWEGLG